MEGIKKIIKEIDENGNEIEVEVTEYPDILVDNLGPPIRGFQMYHEQ